MLTAALTRLGGTGLVRTAGTVKSSPGPVRAGLPLKPKILDERSPHPKAVTVLVS